MSCTKISNKIKKNCIVGIYGDKSDLLNNGCNFTGIDYDDTWTVKRFLNGNRFNLNDKILDMFNYFEINNSIIERRINTLCNGELKLILLVYALLYIKDILVLDYFDKGLPNKVKSRVINYIKLNSNTKMIVISNDLIFLSKLCYHLIVFNNGDIIYNDSLENIYSSKLKIDYPSIISFIKLANKKNAKLNYTFDNKELAKDIYRSVK